jgi:hypothetical protein
VLRWSVTTGHNRHSGYSGTASHGPPNPLLLIPPCALCHRRQGWRFCSRNIDTSKPSSFRLRLLPCSGSQVRSPPFINPLYLNSYSFILADLRRCVLSAFAHAARAGGGERAGHVHTASSTDSRPSGLYMHAAAFVSFLGFLGMLRVRLSPRNPFIIHANQRRIPTAHSPARACIATAPP